MAEALGWARPTIRKALARLAAKGWLVRVARGRYETVLAETGGFVLPNPGAALSLWGQPYYVGFQSAAYEHGLIPDRPGDVQACVPYGARRPQAWTEFPIVLVWQRGFTRSGATRQEVHGFLVWIASAEKMLVDAAARPSRMGGLGGLVRVLDRAREQVGWQRVVELAGEVPRGRPALKRLAHLIDLIAADVPTALDAAATARQGEHPIRLGETRLYGGAGELDRRYGVIRNVDAEALRDEIRR